MAQAARLNLRMQKELKLLVTDSPPGAAFPSLSSLTSSSSVPSLSSIDAHIERPEGSVYEKGVFKLKIEIPKRYPFRTPFVTFVTLIYHPNMDPGGRICLDILNLPPKSREYKYNGQVFNQKARSMTEKYAEVGASKVENVAQGHQPLPNPSIESAEAKG